jgi:predicted transposase YbfD/YdcC
LPEVLDWVMDMTFRDGVCRIRTDNAPENLVTLKHMSANLGRESRPKEKGQGFPWPSP